MCSTGIAVILIIVGMIRDHDVCAPKASEPDFHILNFFTALGAIMFAFAGHVSRGCFGEEREDMGFK